MLLLLFFIVYKILKYFWKYRINRIQIKPKELLYSLPDLPTDVICDILRFTFYESNSKGLPLALRCTEVCRQWREVLEKDLARNWIDNIRTLNLEDAVKSANIETAISMWRGPLLLAPKTMSFLLKRRLAPILRDRPAVAPRRRPFMNTDIDMDTLSVLPAYLPTWKVWHSKVSDPWMPFKYLKTCINEPEWFQFIYTTNKKTTLSIMDRLTVSYGSELYGWLILVFSLPFLESFLTLFILSLQRNDYFWQLWTPTDDLFNSKTLIFIYANIFGFASMEISIGFWYLIPFRLISAICFGFLAYGIKYILKSVIYLTLAYAIGSIYNCFNHQRRWPVPEIFSIAAFVILYPALGIMLIETFFNFPWEAHPRRYFFVGITIQVLSLFFLDPTLNLFRFFL